MAGRAALVQILLPRKLKQQIDRKAGELGLTRSEFIRKACEDRVNGRAVDADVVRYILGYVANPESEEERKVSEAFLKLIRPESWPWEE